jgi:hypothetical protein
VQNQKDCIADIFFVKKTSSNLLSRIASSFLAKTLIILFLVISGLAVGLGVAFYATSGQAINDESDNTPSAVSSSENENITKTEPTAAPSYSEIPQEYPQIVLSSGSSSSSKDKRALLPNISFVAEQTKCDITKLLEWTRPGGGNYCAVPMRIAARTSEEVNITAQNQLIYGLPYKSDAPEGYRGTFFLEDEQAKRVIVVKPGEARDVFLVFDVDKGFVGTTLVPQAR